MNIVTGIAVYFIVWWLVLFTILPIGVRTQAEEGEIVLGTTHSAPARPMLVRKMLATSVVSGILLFGMWYAYVKLGWNAEAMSKLWQ